MNWFVQFEFIHKDNNEKEKIILLLETLEEFFNH